MRAYYCVIATLFIVAPLAAGCGHVSAETVNAIAAPATNVSAVAGNCPAGTGPMRPTLAGTMPDLNGDLYVCPLQVRSITGDTLRLAVDNDDASPDSGSVLPAFYVGM